MASNNLPTYQNSWNIKYMDGCSMAEKGCVYLYYWIVGTVVADGMAPIFAKASATIMMASALITVVCTRRNIDPIYRGLVVTCIFIPTKTSNGWCAISGVWTICGLANGTIKPPWLMVIRGQNNIYANHYNHLQERSIAIFYLDQVP